MTHAEIAALDCRIVALRRERRTYRQIAQALGVPLSRVKTGIHRRRATGLPSTVRRARRRMMDEAGV